MMLSRSDDHLYTGPMERPTSGLNPAAPMMAAQPLQFVPLFYQQGVPVVMSQVPRMPITVLPQPMTVGRQPNMTESEFCHPISNCINLMGCDNLYATVTNEILCWLAVCHCCFELLLLLLLLAASLTINTIDCKWVFYRFVA